jgi:hypothetical protein
MTQFEDAIACAPPCSDNDSRRPRNTAISHPTSINVVVDAGLAAYLNIYRRYKVTIAP